MIVAASGNLNAMSDAASAAFIARAAIDAAGMNVRINAATLNDQGQAMLRVDQVLVEVEKRAALALTMVLAAFEAVGVQAAHSLLCRRIAV